MLALHNKLHQLYGIFELLQFVRFVRRKDVLHIHTYSNERTVDMCMCHGDCVYLMWTVQHHTHTLPSIHFTHPAHTRHPSFTQWSTYTVGLQVNSERVEQLLQDASQAAMFLCIRKQSNERTDIAYLARITSEAPAFPAQTAML